MSLSENMDICSTSKDKENPIEEKDQQQKITTKLNELFSDSIVQRFEGEGINCLEAIQDLLTREADSSIFSRLGLNYGQAVRFKREFRELLPPPSQANKSLISLKHIHKPSMGKLESFSPELRRLYLTKRKRVGLLATKYWSNKMPKFNTPKSRSELLEFAKSVEEECCLPEVGFTTDGIMQHVKDYFCEQRRYKKKCGTSDSSGSSSDSGTPPLPTLPKERKNKEQIIDRDCVEETDYENDSCNSTVIYSDDDSLKSNQASPKPVDESTPNKSSPEQLDIQLNKKSCFLILKSVLGKVPERDELVKLLTGKFGVQTRKISSLTPLQLMEVLVRKLINNKYVSLRDEFDRMSSELSKADYKVLKEIHL